jgi:hypothetical protein
MGLATSYIPPATKALWCDGVTLIPHGMESFEVNDDAPSFILILAQLSSLL